jgi:hypothetical protein
MYAYKPLALKLNSVLFNTELGITPYLSITFNFGIIVLNKKAPAVRSAGA